MNKKSIISIVIGVGIVFAVIFGVKEFMSYNTVSIVFKQSNLSVDIYNNKNNRKTSSVLNTSEVKLKNGSYYYIPTTEQFSSEKVYFTVSGDGTIEVNPSFSSDYLATELTKESGAIHSVIQSHYPLVSTEYIITDETLSHQGEWYSAKLIQRVSGGNEPDVYRIILKKESNKWVIIASPQLVISIPDNPSVPDYIIRKVNEPLSNAAYNLLYP